MSQSFLFRSPPFQLRHSFFSSVCARSRPRPLPSNIRGLAIRKRPPGPSKPSSPSNSPRKTVLGATSSPSKVAPGGPRSFEATFMDRTPTLLFELPKGTYYGPCAYTLVSFIGSMGAWYGYLGYMAKDIQRGETDDWFTRLMYRFTALVLAGAAAFIFIRARGRVRSITAVPINRTLYLRIVSPAMIPLPFIKPFVVTVRPRDVTLSSRIADPRFLAASQESTIKPESTTLAARAKQAWNSIFLNTRRIWTGDQFLEFKVAGKNGTWRLDLLEGLFKDGGKPLDKLVSYDFAI